MSDIIEIPVPVTLPAWRLSKRGNLWLDTGNLLATVLQRRDGHWQGRVMRKGPPGSPFIGERRLTAFYDTAEGAQGAALNLIEAMGGEQ
jgi:hypothetical protein